MLYKISTEETSSMSNSNFLELGVEIDYYLNADHFDACRPWRETVGRNGVVCSVVWYGIRSRAIEIGRNHPAEAVFLAVRVSHRQHFNDLSSPSWSVYLKVDSERKQANYHSNQEAIFKHLLKVAFRVKFKMFLNDTDWVIPWKNDSFDVFFTQLANLLNPRSLISAIKFVRMHF